MRYSCSRKVIEKIASAAMMRRAKNSQKVLVFIPKANRKMDIKVNNKTELAQLTPA